MENSLRIDTGGIRLLVNDDPNRVIQFNPEDVVFVENFYDLMQRFGEREKEFTAKAEALDAVVEEDQYGLPVNTKERIAFIRELSDWMREQIDEIFGSGTSQAAFGEACTIDMFNQFFEGISPYIQKSRSRKVQQYSKVVRDRKVIEDKKRVME